MNCPHCGFGPGFAGTPECKQAWAGDPRARPQYPLCRLREDVPRETLDRMAERYVRASRDCDRLMSAVQQALRALRGENAMSATIAADSIEMQIRDLLDGHGEHA